MYRIAFSVALTMIAPAGYGLLDQTSPAIPASPAVEITHVLPESERATTIQGHDVPATMTVDGIEIVPVTPVTPSFSDLVFDDFEPAIDECRPNDPGCVAFVDGKGPGKGKFLIVLADGQEIEISRFRAWREMRCLAYTAWAEARGEGIDGMLAVMQVIRNRRVDSGHPDTICEVVSKRNQFEAMMRKQSRKWMKAAKNRDLMVPSFSSQMEGPDAWAADSALTLAWRLLTGQIDLDLTDGATFFATVDLIEKKGPEVLAQNLEETLVAGNHVFFRQVDEEKRIQVANR